MMRRREFLGGLGCASLLRPYSAAGQSGRTYHLGTLTPIVPVTAETRGGKILTRMLDERGFKLGQNLTLEARGALGDVTMLPS